jgi:hypothetical protein
MGGVVLTSVLSGQIITRTGRYRAFPIAGTAVVTVGMLLLSRLAIGTSAAASSLYLLVLGCGLGMTMQVLVLAVQNAVDYSVLGAATSGVTMLRGVGGSLGTAVFGAIFTSRLAHELSGGSEGARLTGAQVARLPGAARQAYEQAYVHALHPVFLAAGGVTAAGFVLSWRLQDRPLRATAATSQGFEDTLAQPKGADSLAEIERALAQCTTREERIRFHAGVAERAGTEISPGATWALVRIDEHGAARARELATAQDVEEDRIAEVVHELREHGLLTGEDGAVSITPEGHEVTGRVVAARRELLAERLADTTGERPPEVEALLQRLSRELVGERP